MTGVKFVSLFIVFWLVVCVNVLISTAICFPPDGCRNGGVCVRPGHCSCSIEWEGVRCDERKY